MPGWAACLMILSPPPGLLTRLWPTPTTASPRRTRPRRNPTSSTATTRGRQSWTWLATGLGGGAWTACGAPPHLSPPPPALALAGDVAGRRILDGGCGAGPLLAALRERGAVVTGVDSSTKMLELARERLGDGADLHPADLSNPLPFPDGAFDDVIACL